MLEHLAYSLFNHTRATIIPAAGYMYSVVMTLLHAAIQEMGVKHYKSIKSVQYCLDSIHLPILDLN